LYCSGDGGKVYLHENHTIYVQMPLCQHVDVMWARFFIILLTAHIGTWNFIHIDLYQLLNILEKEKIALLIKHCLKINAILLDGILKIGSFMELQKILVYTLFNQ